MLRLWLKKKRKELKCQNGTVILYRAKLIKNLNKTTKIKMKTKCKDKN